MHRARLAAVVKIVDGVVFGGQARLAELERGIRNRVVETHDNIILHCSESAQKAASDRTRPQSDIRVTARKGFAAQKRGSGESKATELSRPSGAALLDSFVCDVQPKYGVLCCNGQERLPVRSVLH